MSDRELNIYESFFFCMNERMGLLNALFVLFKGPMVQYYYGPESRVVTSFFFVYVELGSMYNILS